MSYAVQIEQFVGKENTSKLIDDFDDELVRHPDDKRRPTRSSRSLAQLMGGGVVPPQPRQRGDA